MKAVRQKNHTSGELLKLLDDFRRTINICIAIGMEENVSSLKALSSRAYHHLSKNILGYYRLCAISSAVGILRNYRRAYKKNPRTEFPYARKLMLTTCYGFKIHGDLLKLPFKPYKYAYIKLNSHTLSVLSGMKVHSITLTPDTLSISYSKNVIEVEPQGFIGVDRNVNNVTIASTDGRIKAFDLSKATMIKSNYRYVKSRFDRNDSRIRQRVYKKYGVKQHNRVQSLLHHFSKQIVEEAKTGLYGIVLENLTGIRKLYRRGNWRPRNYRAKMNSWSYGELQRQIEYKARWIGIPVIYVSAMNTSKRCSICGYKTLENSRRQLWCPKCGTMLDRDENAARNIAARGVRFTPDGPPVEAMVEEPEKGGEAVILKVDGGKPSLRRSTDQESTAYSVKTEDLTEPTFNSIVFEGK